MTAKELMKYLESLERRNINLNHVEIALGDDEELNGIHYGSFVQAFDTTNVKDYKWQDVVNGKVYASFDLPLFDKNTMYKGMELNKEYTLTELELFE